MVPETYHVPVLLNKSIDSLAVRPDGVYIDATFGGGGHSRELLSRLGPEGHLYGFDQDADAERNILGDERFTFVRSNFRYVRQWMRYYGEDYVEGIIADLGVSSHHFDDAERGFSFRYDAPLDMRMNKRAGLTAAEIVNSYGEQQLADLLYVYGELRQSRQLAAAIVKARAQQPIATTGQLLRAVGIDPERALTTSGENPLARTTAADSKEWKKDMARLFQALRIEVNHELEALKALLSGAADLLVPGGRLVVITYHSLEDRMVKNVMKTGNPEGKAFQDFFGRVQAPFRQIGGKVVRPTDEEQARNPRSRSAKLRVAERVKSEE